MKLEDTLPKFTAALEAADHSPLTVQTYCAGVRRFAAWYVDKYGTALALNDLTPTDARAYRTELLNKHKQQPSTINRKLAGLNAYCRQMLQTGFTTVWTAS